MITLIVALVGLFLIVYFFATMWDNVEATFASIFTVVGCVLVTLALNTIVIDQMEGETFERNVVSLQAMQDTAVGQGSFFLGSGSYSEEPAFFYYADRGDYATLEHIMADGVRIVQDDSQTPRIVKRCKRVESNLTWPMQEDCGGHTIYVPEGSIKTNFVLDAKP